MNEDGNTMIPLKEIIKTRSFPFSDSTARRLIRNGIKKKKGKLPKGEQYLGAINLGSTQRPRWFITKSEVNRWLNSKLNQ